MIIVRTLTCPDGVIGLNDWQYLLHPNNTLMMFGNEEEARVFLTEHEVNLEDIEFCVMDDVGLPTDIPVVNNTLGSL